MHGQKICKQNKIGEFIENQKLHFPQSKDNATSTKTEYLSQSRGLIIHSMIKNDTFDNYKL